MGDAQIRKKSKARALDCAQRFLLMALYSSLITIVLAGCSRESPQQQHEEFLAMGTIVSIDIADAGEEQAQEAIAVVRNEIQFLGREWYPWENNGELVRLNKAIAAGQKAAVSPALAKLLARAQEFQRLSGGDFDPAVGRLVELWGFNRGERDPAQPWPDEAQLERWRTDHPTLADLTIDNQLVGSRRNDLLLDLGAIGKGQTVDIGMELLKQHGIANALINAGGNLRAIGHAGGKPQNRPWRVAIRHPRNEGPMAWLELLGDESLSTSGDYERFAMRGAERLNHILDPRTGRSATHTIAVTVVASDATLADAASTAIFVAGRTAWRAVARDLGIRQVLRMDADGSVEVSRELAARLRSPGSEARQIAWRTIDL
jgi:thiamine biosynthesis lipoprotein